jgi:hypothetical protein
MKQFYKVRRKHYGNPYYAYIDYHEEYGEIFKNLAGGLCPKNCVEIVEYCGEFDIDTFIDIHRKEIYHDLIVKNSKYGWLSPFCEWFPCRYTEHEEVATNYLGYDDSVELENCGWVKVYREYSDEQEAVYCGKVNSNQLEWLENHGVKLSRFYTFQ